MESLEESRVPFLADLKGEPGSDQTFVPPHRHISTVRNILWWAVCLMILGLSNTATFYATKLYNHNQLDEICTTHTSQTWSPVQADVDIHYSTRRFNGSFYKESIYRHQASPEVDEAWEDLGTDLKAIVLSVDEAKKSNLELDRLMVGEEYDGPGYVAFLEVTHQLHCLNLLRKGLWFNYEYYRELNEQEFADGERIVKIHMGHCLDILRQQLMCNGDTGLVPFLWVGDPPHQHPDFFREHKCRNYEEIIEFTKRREVKALAHMKAFPHPGALILDDYP